MGWFSLKIRKSAMELLLDELKRAGRAFEKESAFDRSALKGKLTYWKWLTELAIKKAESTEDLSKIRKLMPDTSDKDLEKEFLAKESSLEKQSN